MVAAGKIELNIGEDRHLSIPQTAKRIGIANATVRSLVLKGDLVGELVAGRIVVTRDSVEQYLATKKQDNPDLES